MSCLFLYGASLVCLFGTPIFLSPTVDAEERGDLLLKRTKDLGKTFVTIHEDVYSFGYIGTFLFFSVMEDPVRRMEKKPLSMRIRESHWTLTLLFALRDPPVSCISHRTKEKPSVEHCSPLPPLSRWQTHIYLPLYSLYDLFLYYAHKTFHSLDLDFFLSFVTDTKLRKNTAVMIIISSVMSFISTTYTNTSMFLVE